MMVFQEEASAAGCDGGTMQPAPHKAALGLLPEPVVVLHSLNSSEYVIDRYYNLYRGLQGKKDPQKALYLRI